MTSSTMELRELARSANCRLSEIEGELRVLRNEMRDSVKALRAEARKDARTLWLALFALAAGVVLVAGATTVLFMR
ncbi:hypothetical protein KL86APRO_20017 [uncultured Alphaproteobacteria bacterium]|jgi:hypothetical protein|uniref:Uncharacterized protein n=1 Tax=uncultured Alphaproteobacteria bacterium TaxID=91750 RepID=A0A212KGN7_9PROT|nr:hypothetical protein KL86APRO_20017 [uncultured Alphaproteobacteria bacterium]